MNYFLSIGIPFKILFSLLNTDKNIRIQFYSSRAFYGHVLRRTFLPFILILFSSTHLYGEELETNLQRIEQAIAQIIQTALEQLQIDESAVLVIRAPKQRSGYDWLVERQIVRNAEKVGFKDVYQNSAADGLKKYFIEYHPIDVKVRYSSEKSKDKKSLTRIVSAELFLQVTDADNKVLSSSVGQKTLRDRITKKVIQDIENPRYPFTIGITDQGHSYRRYVEPFLITAVTAGVIYSFYSFRSK